MMRRFFATELEGVATFWRIERRDGVTVGLTNHDRDLCFDGVRHQASPGMVPSAIRRTRDLSPDSAEVAGALCASGLCGDALAAGRFDGASFVIGLVDWETLEREVLFRGCLGEAVQAGGTFQVELQGAKALLDVDLVPRTSPTCRAEFCGPGCNLSPARFTHEARIVTCDAEAGRIVLAGEADADRLAGGWLRWVDGPHAGEIMPVVGVEDGAVLVDQPAMAEAPPGTGVILREGCDRTIAACHARFANAVNFRGEPFLPGNDLVTRHAGMMR
ncbi:hypothetical protein PK98_11120 [Croceibacterium mercuriale]|uniref:Bacteriophage phiJL001 Gp84 C-terminal domain-containing protein n=1 Tax=Croceibacterium mercuriale TaxID=1572751 RepID=A0A0B2BSI7_9SPHN|nr:DUF2163 domain-containing protein [Croceibacterium mercuriale]KHL24538.1 hypothetical protein PK98_11120 [Croceibacterium mercuriale]